VECGIDKVGPARAIFMNVVPVASDGDYTVYGVHDLGKLLGGSMFIGR